MIALRSIVSAVRPCLTRYVLFYYYLYERSFVTIHFHTAKGETKTVKEEPGESVLKAAQRNGIALEGL